MKKTQTFTTSDDGLQCHKGQEKDKRHLLEQLAYILKGFSPQWEIKPTQQKEYLCHGLLSPKCQLRQFVRRLIGNQPDHSFSGK